MRTHTEMLGKVLRGGSFRVDVNFDVVYGPDRLLQGVPVTDWSFNGDRAADIPHAGELTIAYQDDFARSYTPREVTDAFAPFGQQILPTVTISLGPFIERIPLGVYRIDEVPDGRDEFITRGTRRLVTGSVVKLQLLDMFQAVKRAKFRSLEQPASTSAWAEIARLTGLPVTRTVADATVPLTITYDRSRLAAVQTLATILGGRAAMLSDGSIGIIPNTAGAPVFDLQIGAEGVLLDVGYSLSSDDRPNVVIGDFEDAAGAPIHVEAQIESGPLAIDGPYGEHVAEFPDDLKPLYKTKAACQAAVDAMLEQLTGGTMPEAPVATLFDPRLELGDVGTLQRPDRTLTARINKYSMSGDQSGKADMSLTVEVLEDEPV